MLMYYSNAAVQKSTNFFKHQKGYVKFKCHFSAIKIKPAAAVIVWVMTNIIS